MPRLARLDAPGISAAASFFKIAINPFSARKSEADEKFERRYALKRSGYDPDKIAKRAASLCGVEAFRKAGKE